MFAGEGDAFRTNQRFKRLSRGDAATRLSTAFDSVTLYGWDPDLRPDIYGKVGNSGVSIATLDDMKVLYSGFDLCAPTTSVSMTINGPAPMILAMFMNTAIDQQMWTSTAARMAANRPRDRARSQGVDPVDGARHGAGGHPEGRSGSEHLHLLHRVRAQDDGRHPEYFVHHQVQNFYSVSISGYHIAEAGANPISQLAFTLANGFTYVESYLARGMHIDDFAPNLSFFFSNGMDPEYTVDRPGRAADLGRGDEGTIRREERAQKLKYHVQTSGRSLHAQEIAFNDVRTTLQAFFAISDQCNSCTPTPTTRRSPRRQKRACAARWRSSWWFEQRIRFGHRDEPRPDRWSWPAPPRRKSSPSCSDCADFHARHADTAPEAIERAAGRRRSAEAMLRRPDRGRRPALLARADQRRFLRSGGQYRRNV